MGAGDPGGEGSTKAIQRAQSHRAFVRFALSLLIGSQPGFTIARYRAIWSHAFSPELMAISLTGLRKAGLPEE
jgi:hypothetical protein